MAAGHVTDLAPPHQGRTTDPCSSRAVLWNSPLTSVELPGQARLQGGNIPTLAPGEFHHREGHIRARRKPELAAGRVAGASPPERQLHVQVSPELLACFIL